MSNFPSDLRYTRDHEWARVDGDIVTVGITEYAVNSLGDITLVTLPAVGSRTEAGARFGDIDSVKAVSELFAPLTGEVVATNDNLGSSPELVNSDPYGEGWMVQIRLTDRAELDALLSAEAYTELTKNG